MTTTENKKITMDDFQWNEKLNWFEFGELAIDFVDGGFVCFDSISESDILDTLEEAIDYFNRPAWRLL